MKCKICSKEFKKLNRHIPMHGITTKEYFLNYIGDIKYCPVCGKEAIFAGLKLGYTRYCSKSCSAKDQFSDERFRKENGQRISKAWHSKTKEEQNKVKENISEGTKKGMAKIDKEEFSNICSKAQKLRWENISKEDYDKFRENLKKALKDYDREIASQKRKKTNMEKYGVENAHNEEVNKKVRESLRKSRIISKSKPEDDFENKLIELFGKNDVERSYALDKRYPYHCDFYIKSKDLFIELNLFWTHGKQWFSKSKEDLDIVSTWKSKNHLYYDRAIDTWTEKDVEKRETARKNKLNYVVLWSTIDIDLWFNMGCPSGRDWLEEYTWLPF